MTEEKVCCTCDYCGSQEAVEKTDLYRSDGVIVSVCTCETCFMGGRMFDRENEDE